MHLSKSIDISKSSLVGLKAELLRKQEEVKKLKELGVQNEGPRQLLFKNKKRRNLKLRENPEKSTPPSNDSLEDDADDLKKSREVLEAKARLYDKLKCSSAIGDSKNQYLIDFELKEKLQQDENSEKPSKLSDDDGDYESDINSDPENDWVDFVDTLGRSRRCLRRDLPAMKAKDTQLATTLRPPTPPPATTTSSTQVVEPSPELLSWDMQREIMRKKWEEQEAMLLGKKDVHYQDILFDEARPHGVGYFDFSVDEAERERQQEALRQMRKETEEQQLAAAGLRARRQQQLDARLAAARRRKRERMGLPPDEPLPALEVETSALQNKEEPPKEENIEEIKESIKKMAPIAPVRPWDIGKDGTNPVMSQEDWVEMKRKERPAEFAPPSTLAVVNKSEHEDEDYKHNYFTTRKNKCKLGQRARPFGAQKYTVKSKPTVLESYKANYSKTISEESESIAENKDSAFEACIRPSLADMTKSQPLTETHLGVKTQGDIWKPSLKDIDDLLSQAKDKCSKDNSVLHKPENSCSIYKEKLPQNHYMKPHSGLVGKQSPSSDSNNKFVNVPDETIPRHTRHNQNDSVNNHSTRISMINNEVDDCFEETDCRPAKNRSKNLTKRKWAEIAPPPSMSYYINETTGASSKSTSVTNKVQLADSITAGMSYLKAKNNEKQSKRVKGLLDFV